MDADVFLQAVDPLPEAMILVDGEGGILASNRAAGRLLGPDTGARVGASLFAIATDDPVELRRFLRHCSRTRNFVPGTIRVKPDGDRPLTLRVEGAVYRPRAGDDGALIMLRLRPRDTAVARFLALDEKVEELSRENRRRRRIEQELREQREWFRVVLSSIGDAVIVTDLHAQILFMNPVAEAITRWSIEDARGLNLDQVFRIINEGSRQIVESPVNRVLQEGVIVGLANHTILIARDGTEWHIDDSAAPIRGDDGRLQGVVLIFRDVGERRAMEHELRDRARRLSVEDRRKNEFLAMLAHELRNPLAPLQNALHLLNTPDLSEVDLRWSTEIMERQVRQMSRLVDDLLDVSRVIHGKIELRLERASIDRIVRSAVEVARPLVDSRTLELEISIPDAEIPLEVDPARITQVLANLLSNAAKYTEEGGRITLEVERLASEAEIRIRDTGIGISKDLLPSVFDLFTQADQSLVRSQGGLGIGLTLVRTLVQLHGGSVSASSPGPGLGSEFVIRLPLATAPLAPDEGPPPAPVDRVVQPRRVLVVDDLVDSARTLGKLIALMGHEVRLAHSGPAALEEARRFGPEFVLLDIGLPGMDGFEVARRLKRQAPSRQSTLIALTGYGQPSDREQSRLAGFAVHLVKPVDLDQLEGILGEGPIPVSPLEN